MLQADTRITLGAGCYRLRERLGGSAYGVVWRATGERGDVALKLINAAQMERAHPTQRERWSASATREIDFLRTLAPWDERHIVRLLDSGEHEGLPVMALELLDGDLAAHMATAQTTGHYPAGAQVLAWLAQVNQALAKVHQYGWRYLDLKPANVLLDARSGKVKLADFGTTQPLTQASVSTYAGTASWQAPEQFFPAPDGSYATDARSDYFALGAMFYYLVTGGTLLRFCQDCGEAYRQHQAQGAAMLRARLGTAVLVTLADDEIRRFAHHVDGNQRAVDLLRALLAPEPAQRPANALQISRTIAAIHASATQPVAVSA